jgi:5-methylcytosine-specific restriction enzyme A
MIRPRTPTRLRRSHPLSERIGLFNQPCAGCGQATRSTRCPECARKLRENSALTPTGSTRKWRTTRRQKLSRDPICEVETCTQAATEVDHRVAREHGGTDHPSNLTSLCKEHHQAKTRGERLRLRPRSLSAVTFA